MAKQQDTAITGTVGDIIFYKWKDKFCIRSKGRTGTQAPVAVENGGHFGKASGLSARFRKLLTPILNEPRSRKLMYKMNNALYAMFRENPLQSVSPAAGLPHLKGLSLFEQDDIKFNLVGYLSVERTPDGILVLKVPPCNPAYMSMSGAWPYLQVKILVAACDVHDNKVNREFSYSFELPYSDTLFPARDISLPFHCEPGQLTLVTAAMGYLDYNHQPVAHEGWRFAGIIDALWN